MYRMLKRVLDLVAALLGLIVAAPPMVAIAAAVRWTMGTPVLFRQTRPGLNERPFTCLKFRTMTNDRDADGRLLTDTQRTTRLGLFLRRTSLDELPQLWNILRGDLSFVGPRPLLHTYLPYYTEEERRRHSVRPGLTGWTQIHGRNDLQFDKRLQMDIWYVDHVSWWLDFKILLRTALVVLAQRGYGADRTTLDAGRRIVSATQPSRGRESYSSAAGQVHKN